MADLNVRMVLARWVAGAPVTVDEANPVPTQAINPLAQRMFNGEPADGYRIWRDTDDSNHIYILEAPVGSAATDTGFRGIRISKSVTGLSGIQEENAGGSLTFDNRTTDTGWS